MSQLVTRSGRTPRPSRPDGPSRPGRRTALRRCGRLARCVVVAVVLAAFVTHTTSVLIVVVALVIMIMLHELGHLLTAKWGGMKVTEYFLGFGPRLWSIRRGETEYGIKAIPAGGYVKILGMTSAEEVDPADEPRTYRQRPFHNRLLVAVAGSAMHGVMAFVLLWGLFVFIGAPQGNAVAISGFAPLAHNVDPARAAGLAAGDVVERVERSAGALRRRTPEDDRALHRQTHHPGRRARRPGQDRGRDPASRQRGRDKATSGSSSDSPTSAAGRVRRRRPRRGTSSDRWSRVRSPGSARSSRPAGSRATSTT